MKKAIGALVFGLVAILAISIGHGRPVETVAANEVAKKVITAKIAEKHYRFAYQKAMSQFEEANAKTGGPYKAEFMPSNIAGSPSNEILGTFSYGPPFERIYIEFWYSYYTNSEFARIQVRVNRAQIGGRPASKAEKGAIELELNNALIIVWGLYQDNIKPTKIYNDDAYLYVFFREGASVD